MSYILDALKRADSERERGLVPGLHAQPVPTDTPTHGGYRAVKPFMLVLTGVGLVLLCVMLWRWLGPDAAPVSVRSAVPQTVAPTPVTESVTARPAPEKPSLPPPAVSATPESAPSPGPLQTPRMVMAPAQISPAPASTLERGQNPPEPEARSTPSRPLPPLAPLPTPARPANPTIAATPGTPPAPIARVAPLAELPADIRLAIPKLVISGATYADNPAYRMLIINGQVFHEGEKLSTDLQLEQIGPKAAVLNYKGQRYSVGY